MEKAQWEVLTRLDFTAETKNVEKLLAEIGVKRVEKFRNLFALCLRMSLTI